jgi:dTDP-glucose 4,6-dehydratase
MPSETYLVIGSNSFSGSNFIFKILEASKNNKVIGISRSKESPNYFLKYKTSKNLKNFVFFKCNLKNEKKFCSIIEKYRPKYVINYAALGMVHESWQNPDHWYLTNLVNQTIIYKKLMGKKYLKKIIHVTTPEVYGNTNKKLKENFNFNPTTPYAISRAAMDFQLKRMNEQFKFPVIFTRTANVYGPGQQLYRIIPKTIMKFKNYQKMEIHGNGKSIRSFIYIDDVSEATYKILKRGKIGETYHISTSQTCTILSLVEQISKKMKLNYKKNIKFIKDRIGKDLLYDLSSNKLRKKIGWKPKINLKDGIINTINWVENNFHNLKEIKTDYKHIK